MQSRPPTTSANSDSNAATSAPWTTRPDSSTRITASRSAAPNDTTVAGTERWLMLDSCELRS